jgi:4-amino-4-deoxy-L-arabinose transferase-like glycosyltransferase
MKRLLNIMQNLGAREIKFGISDRGLLVLLFILLLGLDLRVEGAWRTVVDVPIRADALDYYAYAYNMRNHGVYSRSPDAMRGDPSQLTADAIRPPLYPLFLYPFAGKLPTFSTVTAILGTQAILGTLSLILAFYIFRSFLSEVLAIAATAMTAVSPHLISLTHYVLTETLFSVILVGMFYFLAKANTANRYVFGVVGALLAAASLTRPSAQYFIVPLLAFLFLHFDRKAATRAAVMLVLGFMLVFMPWIGRNLHTLGTATDNSLAIHTLHHGLYPNFTYNNNTDLYGYPYRADPRSEEISRSYATVFAEIKRRFETEPWPHIKWYVIGKPVAFWSWEDAQGVGDIFQYPVASTPYRYLPQFKATRFIMKQLHWPLVILGLIGCIIVWLPLRGIPRTKHSDLVLRSCSLLLIYFTALHVAGAPFPRYSIPLRPFLYGMAMVPIGVLITCLRQRRTQSQPTDSPAKLDNAGISKKKAIE